MTTVLKNSYSRRNPYDFVVFNQVSDDIVEILVIEDDKILAKNCLPRREAAEFMRECRRQGMRNNESL